MNCMPMFRESDSLVQLITKHLEKELDWGLWDGKHEQYI